MASHQTEVPQEEYHSDIEVAAAHMTVAVAAHKIVVH